VILLRIVLFLGMISHKLVWEILKRDKNAPPQASQKPSGFGLKSIVKLGKSLVLLFLVTQTLFLNVLPISAQPGAIRIVGIAIYFLGLATAVVGRIQLGRNWANLEDYQVLPEQSLVQTGIYRYIRHPIYIGDVMLILGLELALNSWLVLGAIALMAFVITQALREEVVLTKTFPGYDAYRKQTKMFIPYII
jgi:protein-S-isoprenylcysteine O-methyltransferase Ste14